MQAVTEPVAEEAEASGIGLVGRRGGFDLDRYDPAIGALDDLDDDVDLDAGAVPEMREGKWFVNENCLFRQLGYDVTFEEEPSELNSWSTPSVHPLFPGSGVYWRSRTSRSQVQILLYY